MKRAPMNQRGILIMIMNYTHIKKGQKCFGVAEHTLKLHMKVTAYRCMQKLL